MFADDDSVVFAHGQGLDLFAQIEDGLGRPLVLIDGGVSPQGHVFPEHQPAFSGSCHQGPASAIVDNAGYLVSGHVGIDAVGVEHIEDGQIVVLICVEVPEPDHILVGAGREKTLTNPDGGKVLWFTRDGQFHFFLRDRFLSEVDFELNQEQVRSDDDCRTFLLVEHEGFYCTSHPAHI